MCRFFLLGSKNLVVPSLFCCPLFFSAVAAADAFAGEKEDAARHLQGGRGPLPIRHVHGSQGQTLREASANQTLNHTLSALEFEACPSMLEAFTESQAELTPELDTVLTLPWKTWSEAETGCSQPRRWFVLF